MTRGESRRRAQRHPLTDSVHVSDAMTGDLIGRLANISAGGMLLLARVVLTDDALYQIHFALPHADGNGHEPLELGVQVLWLEDANLPGHHWIGVRFVGLGGDPAQRLDAWLAAGRSDAAGSP